MNKLKTLLNITHPDVDVSGAPQLGFRISLHERTKQLSVRINGARQLPTVFGNVKPLGYNVKVTVFPIKEKFETKIVESSWPSYDEEFLFNLASLTQKTNILEGMFLSLTVYAILENDKSETTSPTSNLLNQWFSFFKSGNDEVERRQSVRKNRNSVRHSLSGRRIVGTVTYNLDYKMFSQELRNNIKSTPDIWRELKEMTSGVQTNSREGKKGSVELSLSYNVSEDGKNDVVYIAVTKFRCSLQTMQEHEKSKGKLYIKITAFEYDDLIQKMKSDTFEPTISLKLESTALKAKVNKYNLDQIKILVRLISKNMLGQKILLGRIEVDRNTQLWKEIVETPGLPVTKIVNLE